MRLDSLRDNTYPSSLQVNLSFLLLQENPSFLSLQENPSFLSLRTNLPPSVIASESPPLVIARNASFFSSLRGEAEAIHKWRHKLFPIITNQYLFFLVLARKSHFFVIASEFLFFLVLASESPSFRNCKRISTSHHCEEYVFFLVIARTNEVRTKQSTIMNHKEAMNMLKNTNNKRIQMDCHATATQCLAMTREGNLCDDRERGNANLHNNREGGNVNLATTERIFCIGLWIASSLSLLAMTRWGLAAYGLPRYCYAVSRNDKFVFLVVLPYRHCEAKPKQSTSGDTNFSPLITRQYPPLFFSCPCKKIPLFLSLRTNFHPLVIANESPSFRHCEDERSEDEAIHNNES